MHYKRMHCLMVLTIVAVFVSMATTAEADSIVDVEDRLAEDPQNISLLIAAGRAYLNDAQTQDEPALNRAEECLDRALSLAPDDPQVLVLHGSMLALKGRDATLPVLRMRYVQDGLKEMDRAVALAPTDFGIRYRRGAYCLNLPDIFERAGTAVEDFERLLMMASKVPDSISSEEVTAIRLNLAQAKLRTGDIEESRRLLETVRTDAPGTSYAHKANAMLDEIDE